MVSKSGVSRHFFKVMMPGFQEKLNLPSAFCEKLDEEIGKDSAQAIVSTSKGKWKIGVLQNHKAGLINFIEGWPDFVGHHALSLGDFIVFEHTGGLHFNAFVFEPSECEKVYDQQNQAPKGAPKRSSYPKCTENIKGSDVFQCKIPHFIATIQPHNGGNKGLLNIPVEFMKSNNLNRNMTSATLRDPRGLMWPVSLWIRKRYQNSFRGQIKKGWHEFYTSNTLKDGDVCLFELNPDSSRRSSIVMDVKIFPAPA